MRRPHYLADLAALSGERGIGGSECILVLRHRQIFDSPKASQKCYPLNQHRQRPRQQRGARPNYAGLVQVGALHHYL